MKIDMKTATKCRYLTSYFSIALMVLSFVFIGMKGINWGIDFTGGMSVDISTNSSVTSEQLKDVLDPILDQEVRVQEGSSSGKWNFRYQPTSTEKTPDFAKILSDNIGPTEIIQTQVVGSSFGDEMKQQGFIAGLICMLFIMAYLSYRFEWRLASGSLLALAHDVILVFGVFAITQMEFNLTELAAVLAVLGYSLNDSIIIADRLRETLRANPTGDTQILNNEAVIATFSRTMVTSGTTLITIIALWIMGGSSLHGFAIAMFVGVLTGTWSSISVGTTLPELLKLKPVHYMPKEISADP
ncbi:protein translocase subunit SecF [Paraphotobacterium marinum]|uniref:Protein-export membrane protein SecF n=1 Tax=Paraphotobacterium marinum TaxID=1755811 RepID=A0A220VGK7_9GAMM|nr:protein translocase subunit SecF [Paraphotobacterium marinum]ASK79497.1 protein translocase subunit SecF [Paraphotobacterium marinum]